MPDNPDVHYRTHVFCCINERAPDHPRSCCMARGSLELQGYMKQRTKALGIPDIRINTSGCLERCELGPTMVIYPEGVWYHYESREDIDEIIDRHIMGGERVERLMLEPGQKLPKPRARMDLDLTVSQIKVLTSDISMFTLTPSNGDALPAFEAGAHIDLFTGNGLRRSYSLVNDPDENFRYVIGVLREKDGIGGSDWILDNLESGHTIRATPPMNHFALVEDAAHHTLIAGGIGITPLLAMGYRLRRIGARFTLHYCTKSAAETAFMDEVNTVFGSNVTYHHDGGDPAKGIDLAATLAIRPKGGHLYLCGPAGLTKAARRHAGHWPPESIHYELFSPDTEPLDQASDAFEIVLSRQGVRLDVPVGKSILEVVREAGYDWDSSCEAGICSTCETKLLGGRADHRDDVLSDAEKHSNASIMICVSRAKNGETLILDI
ncbi:MAG: 2Fe-2S iron-sulfur cluster-binding protein [Alphaproteobacteria bacterium]|nr:2Fe-2S iron-sulfur cluster-binding protein [Alphaproteobacteria bacterium]